jgi:hypothetical protein
MSSTLSRKADAWVKANDAFIAAANTRAVELAQSATRLNKENGGNVTTTTTTTSKPRIPWHTTLEDLSEQVDSLSTNIRNTPRLERLVGLSENALDAFERLVDQAENLAAIKFGYDKTSNVTTSSQPAQSNHPTTTTTASRQQMFLDDDDPPTPPRLTTSTTV